MDSELRERIASAANMTDAFDAIDEHQREQAGKPALPVLPRVLPSQERSVAAYRAAVCELVAAEGKVRFWRRASQSDVTSISETAAQGFANATERVRIAREAMQRAQAAAQAANVPAEVFSAIHLETGYAK